MAYWSGRKQRKQLPMFLFGDYNPPDRLPIPIPGQWAKSCCDHKPTEDVREVFNDNIKSGYDLLLPLVSV